MIRAIEDHLFVLFVAGRNYATVDNIVVGFFTRQSKHTTDTWTPSVLG